MNTKNAVSNQIITIENRAPRTSILWKPKDIFLVAGFPEAQRAKRLTRKAIKSEARCAASVCKAKLLAIKPPAISANMKSKQRIETMISWILALALASLPAGIGKWQ